MPDGTWSLAEAKLEDVVEKARSEGPQHLTVDGQDAVVVVSAEDYERLRKDAAAPKRTLTDILFDPRIRGIFTDEEADAFFARDKDVGRPIDL